jgi:hypothetical protein
VIVIDENNETAEYLSTICSDEVGIVRLDLTTFELANGLDTEVVVISAACYTKMSTIAVDKLKKSFGVMIFNDDELQVDVLMSNVIGIYSKEDRSDVILNQIRYVEEMSKEYNILKSQLYSINKELTDVMGGVESQLLRVKKTYELKAPKRLEEFKAFKIFSKYAAGENMGGEFFDIFAKDNKIFCMMSSTSSYLISNSILQEFTELKTRNSISPQDEESFMKNIKKEVEILNSSKKKIIDVDLFTCILDINTLQLSGHSFGKFNILSSNMKNSCDLSNSAEQDFDDTQFDILLQRGERILINSPGFVKSWAVTDPKFMIEELIINSNIKAIDVLDEIFFQIKKDSINGFLANDASSILLEVQKNAIVQI